MRKRGIAAVKESGQNDFWLEKCEHRDYVEYFCPSADIFCSEQTATRLRTGQYQPISIPSY